GAVGSGGGWQSRVSSSPLVALGGAAQPFKNPAMTALVPEVVPRALISPAMAWVISAGQTAQIVGPALGGLLYALGPGVTYLTAGALFILARAGAAGTPLLRATPSPRAVPPPHVFSSGVPFIGRRRVLRAPRPLALFAVLLGGAPALLPVYARALRGPGPFGLGLLRSAPAVGALATSVLLAHYPLERRIGLTLFRA